MMEKFYLGRTLCLLLFIAFNAMPASAAVIYARSGYAADIQTAINGASIGDTISVPAGRYSFKGTVYAPDGIYIRGAGETAPSWQERQHQRAHDHRRRQDGNALQILRHHDAG
jgi:hypothetical protein